MSIDETQLLEFANKHAKKNCIKLKKYQKFDFYIYNVTELKELFKKLKFKDVGNIYKYSKHINKPQIINAYDISVDFDLFQRLAISKKYNSVMYYNAQEYAIYCLFLVDVKYIKEFSKVIKDIMNEADMQTNMFQNVDFVCKAGEYYDVTRNNGNNVNPISATRKSVGQENLVFDKDSAITEAMDDINNFFSDETKTLYKKLQIEHKRGAILHGSPGNGKSSSVRQLIRTYGEDVSKIVINPNISYEITKVLPSVLQSLNGRKALIFIEDLDSFIMDANRSEFLNILDGVDVKTSGVYIIGTTNYPERIDPAIVNRAGRFDRVFKIGNPSKKTRKAFYESRGLDEIFEEDEKDLVSIFTKYTNNLPMATLKEVITNTKYLLATGSDKNIENVIKTVTDNIKNERSHHTNIHEAFKRLEKNKDSNKSVTDTSNGYIMVFVKDGAFENFFEKDDEEDDFSE